MARDVEHICNITDKWCQEGADPARHPDHNSHKGGCICSLGNLTDIAKTATLEAGRKTITL